jgi:hypothetical protein
MTIATEGIEEKSQFYLLGGAIKSEVNILVMKPNGHLLSKSVPENKLLDL